MMTSHPQEQSLNTPPSHIMCIHNHNLIISPQCTTHKLYSTPPHHPLFSSVARRMLGDNTTKIQPPENPTTKMPVAPAIFRRSLGDKKTEELCLGREVLGDFDPTGCNLRPILLAKRSVAWVSGSEFGSTVGFFWVGGFPEEDVYIICRLGYAGKLGVQS